MASQDQPKAWCDFCDRELAFGEGGACNAALFPGYPSGRRRQSLSCVDCMRQRGADDQQTALAQRAAEVWWEGRQQGKDLYVTPEMLKSSPPESESGPTAERAAADTLPTASPASEEREFEVVAGSAELAAAMARRKIPRGHVAVVWELLDGPEGKVRLRVKFGKSPLAELLPNARKAAEAEKQRWRNRASDWWASSKRDSAHCDDNMCLIDGELSMFASKLLLPGDGFMPGGRPIICEECADRRLCQEFSAKLPAQPGQPPPPFQMTIRSVAPAGFVGKGAMVAGRGGGASPRVGDTVEVVSARGIVRARVRDLTTTADAIAWAADAGADVTAFGGSATNGDYAFVLEGIDASAVARGDMLRRAAAQGDDLELEVETPAPGTRRATPGWGTTRLPFQMRVETVAEGPGATQLTVEGPAGPGKLSIGRPVTIVHGQGRRSAVVVDAAVKAGRRSLILSGVATTDVHEGDVLVQEPGATSRSGSRTRLPAGDGGKPSDLAWGLLFAAVGAAMLVGLAWFVLFSKEGPLQSTGGLEGLVMSALLLSIIGLLFPLPFLALGVQMVLKSGQLPGARGAVERHKAGLALWAGVALTVLGLLQEAALLSLALGVVSDSEELWPEDTAARVAALGFFAFPLLVTAIGIICIVKSKRTVTDAEPLPRARARQLPRRPKRPDSAARLEAVRRLSVGKQRKALQRVLEKDDAEEVRLAAARKLAEDPGVVQELIRKYKETPDEWAYQAIVLLAKANPALAADIARHVASHILVVSQVQGVPEPTGRKARLIALMPFLIPVLKGLGESAGGALPEIREDLAALNDVHAHVGGWSVDITGVSDEGRITVLTACTGATGSVLNLESVKNDLLDVLRAIGSEEAAAVLKEMT